MGYSSRVCVDVAHDRQGLSLNPFHYPPPHLKRPRLRNIQLRVKRGKKEVDERKIFEEKLTAMSMREMMGCIICITCHFLIVEVAEVQGYPLGGVSLLLVNGIYSNK